MNMTIIPVGILGTNCYLVESEQKNCVVIDPGAQPDKIAEIIDKKGLHPRYLLLTHGHHDHIGGVKKLAAKYPDMEVFIGEKDHEMLENGSLSGAMSRLGSADDFLYPQAGVLKEGQEIHLDELTFQVLETPGHSKGGVVYLCGDAMFAGDTLFKENCGRCDLYGGDYEVMKASLRRLAGLSGNYTVYPGHGEHSNLDYERRHNPYIAESLA